MSSFNELPRVWARLGALIHSGTKHVMRRSLFYLLIIAVIVMFFVFSAVSKSSAKSRMVRFGLQNIGELATQAGYFTNVQVISNARELFGFTIPFTQNKYIFSYDGTVKAGVDFEAVKVDVDDIHHTISVYVPQPEIISVEIDQDSFEIYDEGSNVFSPLGLNDVNEALTALKDEVENQAVRNGLLENAQTNAENLIQAFLFGIYDSNEYTIIFS